MDFQLIGWVPCAFPASSQLALTEPSSGLSRPARVRESVDFPAPFAPTSAVICPGLNARLMPRAMASSLWPIPRPLVVKIGSPVPVAGSYSGSLSVWMRVMASSGRW